MSRELVLLKIMGLIFMEVSAKTAYQVEEAFKKNAENLL
jgi:hypothetical protein